MSIEYIVAVACVIVAYVIISFAIMATGKNNSDVTQIECLIALYVRGETKMNEDKEDLLINTVENAKEAMGAKEDDYVTVFITVLIGKEEDVLEAEASIDSSVDQDDLPCKSAVIKLSDWIGKEAER